MRRISCVLVVVAVASVAGGWGGGAREGSSSSLAGGGLVATPVAWPALGRLGIAQIETDGRRTWVRTLVPSSGGGGNLFSLDASTLLPRELRVGVRLEEIFAGEGQLWGLPDDGRKVLFIKRSTGEVRARARARAAARLR